MWRHVFQNVLHAAAGLCFIAGANAADGVKKHSHGVVDVYGQPVLKAIPVKLRRPRRVVMDRRGNLLIADAAANKVLRIDSEGKATTLAAGLNEPFGLCLDAAGNCYVANHADGDPGKGSIVRIDKAGKATILAEKLTGPNGIAVDRDGMVYVGLFEENRIVTVDQRGSVAVFATGVNAPAALCFDRRGNLLAVNSTDGKVLKIDDRGKSTLLCGGLKAPSDIAIGPEGEIVVANFGGTQLSRIRANGKTSRFLSVPAQTIGLCFDEVGNLIIVNWRNSWAVKATIRMYVPCPHCKKKIPIRLRPRKNTPPKKVI